jgi:hypothetical protein
MVEISMALAGLPGVGQAGQAICVISRQLKVDLWQNRSWVCPSKSLERTQPPMFLTPFNQE